MQTDSTTIDAINERIVLPENKCPTIRVVPMPSDTNAYGDVFGGWIMSQVDLAGAMHASTYAGGRVVTVAVNSLVFREPVFVGDLLSLYTEITKIGRTSITVSVHAYVQRRIPATDFGKILQVTDATLTFVSIDENRKPKKLPAP